MSYNTDLQTNNDELQTILNTINALPEVLPEQSKTATPSLSSQIITPDSGKTLSSVQVSAITKELLANLDSDFIAYNIAKDIDLFGLVGTLEASAGGAEISTGEFYIASHVDVDGSNPYSIEHGLGKTPDFAIVVRGSSTSTINSFAAALFVSNSCFSNMSKQAGLSYFSNERTNNGAAYTIPSYAKYFTSEYGCLADETYIKIYGKTGSTINGGNKHFWLAGVLI